MNTFGFTSVCTLDVDALDPDFEVLDFDVFGFVFGAMFRRSGIFQDKMCKVLHVPMSLSIAHSRIHTPNCRNNKCVSYNGATPNSNTCSIHIYRLTDKVHGYMT